MEKGAKAMVMMLLVAFLLGIAVIALNQDYRELFNMVRKGTPGDTAIWRSNEAFYPVVKATVEEASDAK
ncbi:MAG: hypothetical protein KA248_02375 [Kiritimatiellae bacterium]|nr:hypothetical protein [Kiritimatiellia bacterium]